MRFGHVGPGIEACQLSHTANSRAKAVKTGNCSGASDRLAQYLQGANGGRVAIFESEFFENPRGVNFDSVFSAAENRADFAIGFSLGDPKKHLGFAWGQAK